eukprot:SAG25_NODE_1_length_41698_cov_149.842015_30_plen_73_part_00
MREALEAVAGLWRATGSLETGQVGAASLTFPLPPPPSFPLPPLPPPPLSLSLSLSLCVCVCVCVWRRWMLNR